MRDVFRTVACAAVLAILTAGDFSAQPARPRDPAPVKQPWEWTIEERLAARLDPANIAERHAAYDKKKRAAGIEPPANEHSGPHSYSIDGDRNPELLLPHEIFVSLIGGFAPEDAPRRRKRELLRPGIVASGFDEELFWAQLYSAASEYIDKYRYPKSDAAVINEGYGRCRAAFTALTNARQVFGRDQFDKFLYEVVAPRTGVASATTAEDPAAQLRFEAGGCQ